MKIIGVIVINLVTDMFCFWYFQPDSVSTKLVQNLTGYSIVIGTTNHNLAVILILYIKEPRQCRLHDESRVPCVADAGESGLTGVGYIGKSGLLGVAYTGEPDHQCGLHRGVHKILFSQKLTSVGYTGKPELSGVGHTG